MSRSVPNFDEVDLQPPICEFCGGEIHELDPECPALEDRRCAP